MGTQVRGGSRNVRASELTNIPAMAPGAKPRPNCRTRLRASFEPQESVPEHRFHVPHTVGRPLEHHPPAVALPRQPCGRFFQPVFTVAIDQFVLLIQYDPTLARGAAARLTSAMASSSVNASRRVSR